MRLRLFRRRPKKENAAMTAEERKALEREQTRKRDEHQRRESELRRRIDALDDYARKLASAPNMRKVERKA